MNIWKHFMKDKKLDLIDSIIHTILIFLKFTKCNLFNNCGIIIGWWQRSYPGSPWTPWSRPQVAFFYYIFTTHTHKFKSLFCNQKPGFFFIFDLETQNLKVRSLTETVLDKSKKNIDAFLTKQYCRNWRACTFLLYELECYIFLIDLDIGCSL